MPARCLAPLLLVLQQICFPLRAAAPCTANTCDCADLQGVETGLVSALTSPSQYDSKRVPDVRPVRARVTATITKLAKFSTQEQSFSLNMYFRHQWEDSRLQWTPSEWCGLTNVTHIKSSSIWVPDSFFAHGLQATYAEEYTYLTNDGSVMWSRRALVEIFCKMDFMYYPFDQHVCPCSIESYGYSPQVLSYESPRATDKFQKAIMLAANTPDSVGLLELVDISAQAKLVQIEGSSFASVEQTYTFRRKIGTYVINTFIPLWLIVAASCCGLWISPNAAPARVAVAVISLLVLINRQKVDTEHVPEVPYVIAFDLYLFFCIIVGVVNVIEYAVVNFLLTRLSNRMDRISRVWAARAALKDAYNEQLASSPRQLGHTVHARQSFCVRRKSDTAPMSTLADSVVKRAQSFRFQIGGLTRHPTIEPSEDPDESDSEVLGRRSSATGSIRNVAGAAHMSTSPKGAPSVDRSPPGCQEPASSPNEPSDERPLSTRGNPKSDVSGFPDRLDSGAALGNMLDAAEQFESPRQGSREWGKEKWNMKNSLAQQWMASLDDLFNQHDAEGNGQISVKDLAAVLQSLCVPDGQLAKLLKAADKNHDCWITRREFRSLCRTHLLGFFKSSIPPAEYVCGVSITERKIFRFEEIVRLCSPAFFLIFNVLWFLIVALKGSGSGKSN